MTPPITARELQSPGVRNPCFAPGVTNVLDGWLDALQLLTQEPLALSHETAAIKPPLASARVDLVSPWRTKLSASHQGRRWLVGAV